MKKFVLFIAAILLCGTIHAQEYHYTYDFHEYENVFPLTGEAYLNGELLASPSIEIAAFVGEDVRGTEFLLEVDPDDPGHYFVWLGVSFTNSGETVTFRMYDHATGTEYTDCSTTVLTNQNGYGEPWDPFKIYFTTEEPVPFGPEYPWTVSVGYENYMFLETQIQINGVPVTNTNWIVGAFCGDECRGVTNANSWWTSDVDQSLICEIQVGGYTGDVINFYLYDVENEEVLRAMCNVTLDWIDDDIGDMFDPLVLNFVTEQTFTKSITAYTEGERDHYYIIASPIGTVNPEEVTDMLSNSYDLYYFDHAASDGLEWITYKAGEGATDPGFDLEAGKGYLYANSEDVTLTFTGFPYTGNGQVTLTKTGSTYWEGWNLVGNPFSDTAYIGRSFYKMNSDGTDFIASSGAIEPMEGVFVVANTDGETLTFTTQAPSKTPALVVNLTRDRGVAIDRAIVQFGESDCLPKRMLNPDNTKLYIPQANVDYAVVPAEADAGEMPLSFKAEHNGTYTLSFASEEVSFSYLHLIDNITGADVDLLNTTNYTFSARTTDYASRFRLVFATGNSTGDVFAFYNNGNWIINNDGDATLQVVDAMGRVLSSERISGSTSKAIHTAPGVYMLRLINGDNVKVQKIIVK